MDLLTSRERPSNAMARPLCCRDEKILARLCELANALNKFFRHAAGRFSSSAASVTLRALRQLPAPTTTPA
ncbi:MAG: hypothetical protein Q7T64_01860 [Lacisediminimonas sp.]|nr:hypothetical protein [Lacisediminimonas sp.]MDO9217891.1 hypothetical protein [Lacisediminimonas sp.]